MSKPMTDERLTELEPLFRKWGFAYNEIRDAGLECLDEIRRLRQEVKDLSQAQFIAEERKETTRKDREAMQRCLDMSFLPLGVRRILRDRLEAGDD